MLTRSSLAIIVLAALSGALPAAAQSGKNPPTKGQAQISGGLGVFGTIYSLRNHFNFELLSARYTLDPFIAYESLKAKDGQKILVADFAIKNTAAADNFFNSEGVFVAVDQDGAKYGFSTALKSTGVKAWPSNLKPGQGLGQPALNNPLQVAFMVPDKARIVKILVQEPLLLEKVDVLRYYIAGATKEEAGAPGNPKNIIAPLPAYARDDSDKTGAVALDEVKGAIGTYMPSGNFDLRLDSFKFSTDPIKGTDLKEGSKYAIATVTAKYRNFDRQATMFEVAGGDFPQHQITTSESDRSKPVAYLKAARDENAEHAFENGDEYQVRIVFVLPKEDTIKKLIIGCGGSHKISFDMPVVTGP